MIIAAHEMRGLAIKCSDGVLGTAHDLLCDDQSWRVTFFVVHLGRWLSSRRVLVAPDDVTVGQPSQDHLAVRLTRDQLCMAPTVDSHQSASWQQWLEAPVFAWDACWPHAVVQLSAEDWHVHSVRAVTKYRAVGVDDHVGRMEDFLIDDHTWEVCYVVVRIGPPRSARRVLVEPRWIDGIDEQEHAVRIGLRRAEVEQCRDCISKDFVAIL